MNYLASNSRYSEMPYKKCGRSGIKLPLISLGLWHNFGGVDVYENSRNMVLRAFDLGITHVDLANNYGPPPGSAEETFGQIMQNDLRGYRDELFISTKAGYKMWEGPYGEWGSRKYLISSLDQSLKRMKIDYVDLFYSHRPDPETPIEETMMALDYIVRSGKALYVGISNYNNEETEAALKILKQLGTPCLIHQARYSMFDRWVENGLVGILEKEGVGCIAFSPLAQGMLTNKYLQGIPEGSRASKAHGFLKAQQITDDKLTKIALLNEIAKRRGQTLAEMAITWLLKDQRVTSVLIGVSSVAQIEDCVGGLKNLNFDKSELDEIENILK